MPTENGTDQREGWGPTLIRKWGGPCGIMLGLLVFGIGSAQGRTDAGLIMNAAAVALIGIVGQIVAVLRR